jgi:hypothetical protein
MLSFNTFHFVIFSLLSLSANAETVRGAQRELDGTAPVNLGVAGDYAILSKTGVSTVPSSAVTGDIAVSPAAATYLTGFALTLDSGTQYSTSTQIVGQAHSASYGGDVATKLTSAVSNMEAAYTDAAGRANENALRKNIGAGILGVDDLNGGTNAPLTPGVYTFGSSVTIADKIYFDGSASDIFIIQITGDLLVNFDVELLNGALASNIFWQVAGEVIVAAGSKMKGILLVKTAVMFETKSELLGRVLTQTHCALQVATITQP